MHLKIEDLLGIHHKLIMDPIHGGIPILSHEVKIIDHPLFQRLRFICQNDILSLVFPGATHSRFLHSIGVMHVGGRMFKALIENSLKTNLKKHNGIPEGVSPETLEAISFFNQIVRCACLLHDVGHCSFSHQFSRTPTIKKVLADPDLFTQLWSNSDLSQLNQNPHVSPEINTQCIYPKAPTTLEHEHFSVRTAWEILSTFEEHDLPFPTGDILSLMETTTINPSKEFTQHAFSLWQLIQTNSEDLAPSNFPQKLQELLSTIVSGELDADRADYMLRDGFHSSVTIGGFNLDHLLSNLHFGWCPQTQWFGLAIAEKGLSSLEDFVYSRHQMYRQVYAHKTAQGFDWLLRAAIDEVMAQPEVYTFVVQCLGDIDRFKNLTDNYFWEAFRQYTDSHSQSYSDCILKRIKMKHLATRGNLSIDEQQHYLEFLANEHQCSPSDIIPSSITARFTKINNNFTEIKVLVSDHRENSETLRLISTTSQFFGKFTDEKITHFYLNTI